MVSESKGLEQPFTLTLTAARDDVAITFEHDSFYPPVIDENALLHFEFTAPQGEHFDLTFRVNGDNNTAGIYIFSEDALLFTNEFMNSYQGPWPAKFELVAIQNGDIVATATLNLLDVRKVVVDSLYIIPLPSDQITIPTEGETIVVAAPRFFDKEGIPVPFAEVHWVVRLLKEVPGVSATAHIFTITPSAEPGVFNPILYELTSNTYHQGTIHLIA